MFAQIKLLLLCVLTVTAGQLAAEHRHFETPPRFNILMIYSGNRSNEACLSVAEGVQTALLNRSVAFSLEVFELNILYDHDPGYWDAMMATYMPDIQRPHYNLIIAEGNEGAATLLKRLGEVPEQTSVIFTNLSQFDLAEARRLHRNTTLVRRSYDAAPNIRLGLRLFPETEKVILLTSSFDWQEQYRRQYEKLLAGKPALEVLFFDDDRPETLKQVSAALHAAGPKSFVVSMDWDRFFANRTLNVNRWSWLKRNYARPIFVRRKANLDFGIGGVLQNLFSVGALTGEFAEKIASGTRAENIAPEECPAQTAFNMRETERLNLPRTALSEGSRLYNLPRSWFRSERNRLTVVSATGAAVVFLLAGAIVLLLVDRRRQGRELALIRKLPASIAVFDRNGGILYLHLEDEAGAADSPDTEYRHVSDLPGIDTQKTLDAIAMVLNTGKSISTDYDFYGAQSSASFLCLEKQIFGRPAVLYVSVDSSRLQQEYEATRLEVRRFAMALRPVTDALTVTDRDGNIVLLNPAAEKRFSRSRSDAVGTSFARLVEAADPAGTTPWTFPLGKVLDGRVLSGKEYTSVAPDGTARHELIFAEPLRDDGGRTLGAVIIFQDVSGIWRERDEHRSSMQLMEFAIQYTDVSFFRMDLKTEEISPLIGERLRLAPLFNGKSLPLPEWVLPEDLEKLSTLLKRLNQGEINRFDEVFRSDYFGVRQYLSVQATLHTTGSRKELIGIARDITQKIIEEKKNREASTLQQNIEDAMPYPVFLKDPEDHFRYLHCNRAFAGHLGLAPGEVIGKTDYDLFAYGSDADLLRSHDREVVKTGKLLDCEEEYHIHSGEPATIRVVKQLVNGSGSRKLLLGIFVDVTEEALTKAASHRMLEFFNALIDRMPAGFYVKDADDDFRYLIWNKQLARQTGIAAEAITGRNDSEYGMPKAEALLCANDDRAVMQSGETQYTRRPFPAPDSEELVCDVYRTPLECAGRRYLLGMNLDVTSQLKSLESLRTSDRNADLFNRAMKAFLDTSDYRAATAQALEMFARAWDADRGFLFRREDDYFVKELEWSADGGQLLARYADTEMPSVLSALREGRTLAVEDTLQLPDSLCDSAETLLAEKARSVLFIPLMRHGTLYGEIGFIWMRDKHVFSDSDDRCVRDIGSLFLIAREQELQRNMLDGQDALREKIFDNISIPLSLLDDHSNLLAANAAFCDLFRIPRTGILNKNCQELCPRRHSDDCVPEKCPILFALERARETTMTISLDDRTVQANAFPILNADGKVQYVLQTHMDVTRISREKQTLKEFLDQNKMIRRCTEILLLEPDLKKAFGIMARTLDEYYSGFSIRIMRALELSGGTVVEQFAAVVQQAHEQSVVEHARFREDEFPAIFSELRTGKILTNRLNTASDATAPQWKTEMAARQRQLGFSDVMLFPLFCKGVYWGYMDVDRGDRNDAFGAWDKRIFKEAKHVLETVLEREAQQQNMRREKNVTAQLFDRIAVPMLLIDASRKIRAVNRSLCQLFQTEAETLIGQSCRDGICGRYHVDDCASIHCPLLHTLNTGKAAELDYPCRGRVFHWWTQPVFGLDGKVEYVLDCALDVTGERQLQRQFAEQARDLKRLTRTQNLYLEQDRHIAECLKIVIFEKNPDAAWEKILSRIGAFLETEGVALMKFENGENAGSTVRNIWLRDRSLGTRYLRRRYPAASFAASNELLRQGKVLHGWQLTLRPEIPWEKEFIDYCAEDRQCELVALPIRCAGQYWGHLAVMQSLNPPFNNEQMRQIEQFAHIIEILLNREAYLQSEKSAEYEKQLIIDAANFPLVLFDAGFTILNANRFALQMNHVPADWRKHPDGCRYCRFRNGCDPHAPQAECLLNNARRTGLPQSTEIAVGDAHYKYTAIPVVRDGETTRILLSGMDITNVVRRRQQMDLELQNAEKKATTGNAFYAALARDVARRVSELLERLRSGTAPESPGDDEAQLLSMLDSAAKLSSLEAAAPETGRVPTDAPAFFEKLREKYLPVFRQRGLTFELNMATGLPALLLDAGWLETMLSFFIEKAMTYTTKGGVLLSVEYAPFDEELTLSVRDTGCGIESESLNALLSPAVAPDGAWQGDMNPDRLQLLLQARTIRSRGGSVRIQSRKGAGSCFVIALPAQKAKDLPADSTAGPAATAGEAPAVMVVDDVLMNVKVLSSMLKKLGCTPCPATSGQEALDKLQDIVPRCVLTDLWMPGINGVELAGHIRRDRRFDAVPLFSVTADAESERSFDMSVFQGIIIKPVTLEKLKQTLASLEKK